LGVHWSAGMAAHSHKNRLPRLVRAGKKKSGDLAWETEPEWRVSLSVSFHTDGVGYHPSFPLRGRWERNLEKVNEQSPLPLRHHRLDRHRKRANGSGFISTPRNAPRSCLRSQKAIISIYKICRLQLGPCPFETVAPNRLQAVFNLETVITSSHLRESLQKRRTGFF